MIKLLILILIILLSTLTIANVNAEDNSFPAGATSISMPQDFVDILHIDLNKDIKSLQKLSEKGNPIAQLFLGIIYEKGEVTKQDYKQALKWFRKSAEQGNMGAQYELGKLYLTGRGVDVNFHETIKWFRKSAKQGETGAQNGLGILYQGGYGVVKDYFRSYVWLIIALANEDSANQSSINYRDNAEKFLSPEKIIQAQSIAKQCLENRYEGCE